jgi:hypothetical protein
MWAREKDESGQAPWPEGKRTLDRSYERIAAMAPSLPSTRLVVVADREVDLIGLASA